MRTLSDTVIAVIIRRRVPILVAMLLLTVGFGAFIPTITVNNDPRSSVPAGLQEMEDFDSLRSMFSTPRSQLLIAEFGDSVALSTKIDSIVSWGEQFEQVDGVLSTVHIGKVKAPLKGGFLGLTADYVVPRKKRLSDDELRARIREHRDFTGALVSDNERALGMLINISEDRSQIAIATDVRALQARITESSPATVQVTGGSLYTYEIDQAMRRDFILLLPLCVLVVLSLLYWVFRRRYYVAASLGIITVALVWTFGIMGIFGIPFTVVTAMTPVILFPVGVASAIHVFKTYARNRYTHEREFRTEIIQNTFRELLTPIFLSAVTTFFGFASFAFSKTIWTRNFGICTAVGVALALLFSILLLPIVLHYDRKDKLFSRETARTSLLPEGFWRPYDRVILSSLRWMFLALIVVVVAVFGFMRVTIEGNPIKMFDTNSDVRRADDLIGEYLGGTRLLHVVLTKKTGKADKVEDWLAIQRMADHFADDTLVGQSTSLLPLIHNVSRLLNDTDLSQAGLSMVLSGKGLLGRSFGDYIATWVSPDKRSVKISFICRNVGGTPYSAFASRIRDYVRDNFPEWDALVAGPPLLNDAMTLVLVETQISSMLLAFACVFLVLCVLFRSVKVGLFAVLPIILSTVFVYALMGLVGVAVNTVTIITVNTCIGIGIDYSIHFVAGYFYVRNSHPTRHAALLATARTKGSVIMFNTFVVGIGFLVLWFSSFPPIRHFGIFVFVSMVASSLFALVFPPAMFAHFGVREDDSGRE